MRGLRPLVPRQINYRWDYLYGALGAVSSAAHFAHLPGVSLEWDEVFLPDLAASDGQTIHVLVRDQAGFHLRDGDPRLPARVRVLDLPPSSPELNPCEWLWDVVKDEICRRMVIHCAFENLRLQQSCRSILHLFKKHDGSSSGF